MVVSASSFGVSAHFDDLDVVSVNSFGDSDRADPMESSSVCTSTASQQAILPHPFPIYARFC